MKQFYHRAIILAMIIAGITNAIQAQNFHVVDVNKSKDANPTNNTIFDGYDWGHSDTYYAVLKGVAYFSADDGIHGAELWRSDGTAGGTYMIKDIYPGSTTSNVRDITISGGKIFFSANDGVGVQEIWVSDGTAQGTHPVIDLGSFSTYNPTYLTDVNGALYFFTDDLLYGLQASQLWETDGTSAGTVMIADLFNNPSFNYSYQGRQITNMNGHVFFSISTYGYASELGFTDGTTTGTVILNSINPYGYGSNPSYLTPLNGLLYFSADDGTGLQLWASDGTIAGTHKINNANSVYLDNDAVYHFQILKNTLYFTGYTSDGDGPELCKYDASNAANNVERVKDINPGAFNNNMYNFVNVNGTLYFSVYSGKDQTLWKSDGTTAGTQQVKDINPGGHNIYLFKHFINANGTLLFSFYDDASGYELWKSDGSSKGTQMVKEINPGAYSSWVTNISYLGKNISLFEAYDGKNGFELWRTDGTAQGTWMVKNINQTSTASSNPVWLTPSPDNQSLIFAAYDPEYGHEMRITDGTEWGTRVIKDIYKGSFDSWPYLPANYKNATYFFANIDNPVPRQDHGSDVFLVSRFWKTDGTEKGTSMISVPPLENLLNDSGYVENPPSGPIATENLLYLVIFNNATYQQELWRSDGTTAGTYAIRTNINPWYNIVPTPAGKNLFFIDFDITTNTSQLWVTDGTSSGTHIVNGVSYPQDLFAFKRKLYFVAYDPVNFINDLWMSDGSVSGASLVKTIDIAWWVPFAQANGKLFFTANDFNTTAGYELWATDGTTQGTRLVKDIYPTDYFSSFPSILTGAGSLVYFTAADSAHGYEIWKSDGTSRGTQLVKDITPGIDGSYGISNLISVNNQLYFLNNGYLWTSDGTSYGTSSVSDASLNNVCCISNMVSVGNNLAFTGYSYTYGSEMWMGNAACGFARDNSVLNKLVPTEEAAGTTSIYPNPAHDILNVRIASSADSRILVTLTDINGTPLITKTVSSGETSFQMNIAGLASGVYFVKIISTSSSESTVKKFVKL